MVKSYFEKNKIESNREHFFNPTRLLKVVKPSVKLNDPKAVDKFRKKFIDVGRKGHEEIKAREAKANEESKEREAKTKNTRELVEINKQLRLAINKRNNIIKELNNQVRNKGNVNECKQKNNNLKIKLTYLYFGIGGTSLLFIIFLILYLTN
jgi:hypothetical protein